MISRIRGNIDIIDIRFNHIMQTKYPTKGDITR